MKALRLGFALGTAMLVGAGAAPAQQQVVKVGYGPFGPPVNSLPGSTTDNYKTLDPQGTMAQGAMIDLVNAIAKDSGFQVQFIALVAGDQLPGLTARTIDLAVGRPPAAGVESSSPIFNNSEALVVIAGDKTPYRSIDEFKGQPVGVGKGTPPADLVQKSGADAKVYDTDPEALQALHDGKIKAFVTTSAVAMTYRMDPKTGTAADLGYGVQVVKSYQPKLASPSGIVARQDEADLMKKINGSLAKLKADGTTKAIFAKYGIDFALVN